MSLIQPTAFWLAVAKLWSPSFLFVAVTMLLCLELVARIAPFVVGKQVHQRYLYSTRICLLDCTNQGKQLTWIANGRGARGDLPHNQPMQIAIFGSSTSEDALLDQEQTWAQRLKHELGDDFCHVDNYARDDSYHNEAIAIMNELYQTGHRYDVVLLQINTDPLKRKYSLANAFHYWGKWQTNRTIRFTGLLPKRVLAQFETESLYELSRETCRYFLPGSPLKHPPHNSRANRQLRETGQVRLLYQPRPQSAEDRIRIRELSRQVFESAHKIADRVYFVAQPVAYDEHEHSGVSRKWFDLYPIPDTEAYYDNRSVAESIRTDTSLMTETAQEMGIPVIDLDNYMRPQLFVRDDLFDDKWHYAPAGARLAAEYVAKVLRKSNDP